MRELRMIVLVIFTLPLAAGAQTKITGKTDCAKPEVNQTVDVGDRQGHVLALQKATCKYTSPLEIAGIGSKEGIDVSTSDMDSSNATQRGYHIATMTNGDKFTVKWEGKVKIAKDGSATFDGKWSFITGTGKLKGIKGGGVYKGSGPSDGSSVIDIEGEYTLPAEKPSPAKKQ